MRKLFTKLVFLTSLIFNFCSTAYAEASVPDLNNIFRRVDKGYPLTENVQKLPDATVNNLMSTIINTVLDFSMILTLVSIIVAALYYLFSMGNEEETNKAKSIILYLIIGVAIISGALGIVTGILKFQFLE